MVPPNSQYYGEGGLLVCVLGYGVVGPGLRRKSRTYFWGERADAAVDYGLGWADI